MTDEPSNPVPVKEEEMTALMERKCQSELSNVIRIAHDNMDLPDGYRAEIVGGQIVVSASPFGRHAFIIRTIRRAVSDHLEQEGYDVFENTTLEEPVVDRYIPDLVAWPIELMRSAEEQWIFSAADSIFAAEVTSPKQEKRDYTKAIGYARGGVPVYLLVDRKARECVVYTDPRPSGYATMHTTPFGEDIELPFGAVIDTSEF